MSLRRECYHSPDTGYPDRVWLFMPAVVLTLLVVFTLTPRCFAQGEGRTKDGRPLTELSNVELIETLTDPWRDLAARDVLRDRINAATPAELETVVEQFKDFANGLEEIKGWPTTGGFCAVNAPHIFPPRTAVYLMYEMLVEPGDLRDIFWFPTVVSRDIEVPPEIQQEVVDLLWATRDKTLALQDIPPAAEDIRNGVYASIVNALSKCGDAGFDKLMQLSEVAQRSEQVLIAIGKTRAAGSIDFLVEMHAWAEQLPPREAMYLKFNCVRGILAAMLGKDMSPDVDALIHATIDAGLDHPDHGCRIRAIEIAGDSRAWEPKLRELAENDPHSEVVRRGTNDTEELVYPVRVEARRALSRCAYQLDPVYKQKLRAANEIAQLETELEKVEAKIAAEPGNGGLAATKTRIIEQLGKLRAEQAELGAPVKPKTPAQISQDIWDGIMPE